MAWIDTDHDWGKWQAFVDMETNFRVPWNVQDF
jgi:hypothetical protein